MNKAKKLIALLLVMIMIVALGTTAFADDPTGKITITNASAGQEYKLFKLFDATYDATTQKTAYSTSNATLAGVLAAYKVEDAAIFVVGTKDSAGNYSVSVAEGKTDAALAWIKANYTTYGTQVGDAKTITTGNTIEWDVPYGYYYVTSALGTEVTIDNNTPSVSIIDKNTTEPTIPEGGDGKVKTVDKTDYSIGDTAKFTVTFEATNFVTKNGTTKQITKYVITDTPTNFKLNSDIVVKVDDVQIDAATAFDSNGKLELAWVDDSGASLYASPATVVITYSGKMTKGAAETGTASNMASVAYVTDGDPVIINPDDPGVTVETYNFTLKKTDGTNNLSGAEFHLYDAATAGNEIALVKAADGTYHVADADEQAAQGFTPAVIVAGEVTIKGLKAGKYYLEETKAPQGYNKLEGRTEVTVASTGENSVTVVNQAGIELPSTGGAGTTMLIVFGSVLFMATVIVLVTKKRMYNEGC